MTIAEFDKKYSHKGGIVSLQYFRDNHRTLAEAGRHFGVSKERVRHWMKMFWGVPYDVRTIRQKEKMEEMIGIARYLTRDQWLKKYQNPNPPIYQVAALTKIYELGIWDDKL